MPYRKWATIHLLTAKRQSMEAASDAHEQPDQRQTSGALALTAFACFNRSNVQPFQRTST